MDPFTNKLRSAFLFLNLLLVAIVSVGQNCNNQVGTNFLCADFSVEGFNRAAAQIIVAKDQEYKIANWSINLCQLNTYTWSIYAPTIHPNYPKYTLLDATTSTPRFKIHVPGVYSIKLHLYTTSTSVIYTCGTQVTDYTRWSYIKLPYTTPVAKFNSNGSASNKTITQGATVSLTDASDNYPTQWSWSVSPSTGVTYVSGNSSSQNPKIKFANAGTYSISMMATNEAGSHPITKTNHITVNPAPITVDFAANNNTTGPVWVTQNAGVSLTDLSTNTPHAWKWTISPASGFVYSRGSSTEQAPVVNFSTIGVYDVSLMATNTLGSATKPKTGFIVVRPIPPSAPSPVIYCVDAATVNLTATGTSLKWYASAGSTTVIPTPKPSSSAAGTTYYYVSQTISGIESPRATVAVVVNPPAAGPAVTSPIYYCQNSAASPLTATGTNLKWYTVASGGSASGTAPTPSTTALGGKDYFVSQTDAKGCESLRSVITVNVISSLGAPIASSPVNYCLNGEAFPLTASNTNGATGLKWYTVSSGGTELPEPPTPVTTASGTVTYYVSQTKAGCVESVRKAIAVNTGTTAVPNPPVAVSDLTYEMNEQAPPLQATGANLKWYFQAVGGVSQATPITPSTFVPGERNYYVSQTVNGCESWRAQIKVLVNKPGPGTAPNWSSIIPIYSGLNSGAFGKTITRDKNGNIYVTGGFNKQINIGKDTLGQDKLLTPVNFLYNSVYVVKYRSNMQVEWAVIAGGGYNETTQEYAGAQGYSIAVDKDGNTLVTGIYRNHVQFDNITLADNLATGDIFLAKYSPAGNLLWAKRAGNTNEPDYVWAVTTDKDANVYISGLLTNSMMFGGITVNGTSQAYLAKYNTSGTPLWVKTIGGPVGYSATGRGIVSDTAGNTFMTGDYLLLAKHNAAGTLVWKKSMTLASGARLNGRSVYRDADGNIFVCGDFRGTVTLDNGSRLESALTANTFIIKFNSDGVITWVTSGTGLWAYDLVTDEYGCAYIAGEHLTAKLGKFSVAAKGGNTDSDLFLAKLDQEGVPLWFKSNGSIHRDAMQAMEIDGNGQLFVKGYGYGMTLDSISFNPPFQSQFILTLGSSLPAPKITSIEPASGYPFTKVTISGEGMLNTDSVTFNGKKATFKVVNTNTLEATVPENASSGDVKIALSRNGTLYIDSAFFKVKEYNVKAYPLYKWKWAKLMGTREDLTQKDMATDANGNVYVTGEFTNTMTIGDTTITTWLTSCMYLAKFSPTGDLMWLRSAGGNSPSRGVRLVVDNAGNVTVAGTMQNDYDGGSFSLGDVTLDLPVSNSGVFVAKLSPTGELIGMQGMGGNGSISVSGLGTNYSREIYLTGNFSGTATFGPFTLSSAGGTDHFLVRFHPSLQYPYSAIREGTAGNDIPWDLARAEYGNTYVTENKSGAVTLRVYGSLGAEVFSRSLVDPIAGGAVFLSATSMDQFNNLYLTGRIVAKGKFQNTVITSSTESDAFVAKYKANGDLDWVRNFHGTFPSLFSSGTTIFANNLGEIYVGGVFQYNMVFGKDTLRGLTANKNNIFFNKFDSLGNVIWSTFTGNTVDHQTVTSMYTNPNGHLYVSGSIIGDVPFGDTTLVGGAPDVPARYLAKMQGAPETPVILSFTPEEGSAGDTILVEGRFLNVWEGKFNETPAYNIIPVSGEAFKVVVPVGASTGAIGAYNGVGFGKSEADFKIISSTLQVKLCPGSSGVLVSSYVGNNYKWQSKKLAGDFEDIQPSEHFADVLTSHLKLVALPSGYFGTQFRCIVDGVATPAVDLKFVAHWNGSKDQSWENLENWGCGRSLPDAFTEVIIPAGAIVEVVDNITIRKLTVGDGAVIKVKPGVSVEVIDPK